MDTGIMNTGIKISGQIVNLSIDYSEEEERLVLETKIGSIVIGRLVFQKDYTYDEHSIIDGESFVYLESLWVHSGYRQNGIANYLMRKGLDMVSDFISTDSNAIYLDANPTDFRGLSLEALISFYESFGFDPVIKEFNSCSMLCAI